MDDLFTKMPPEWWYGHEMSSAHDAKSIKSYDMPNSYVLVCYPRDGTVVCNAELIELQQKLGEFKGIEVMAASTDSPETHNRFFTDEEAFDPKVVPNIEYGVLTIKENILTALGKTLLLNEYGYCRRIAVIVVEGAIRGVIETHNDVQRDISTLAKMTANVMQKP